MTHPLQVCLLQANYASSTSVHHALSQHTAHQSAPERQSFDPPHTAVVPVTMAGATELLWAEIAVWSLLLHLAAGCAGLSATCMLGSVAHACQRAHQLEGVRVGDGYGLLCNSLGLSPSLALQAYSNTAAAAGMIPQHSCRQQIFADIF